jgi:hypothetical protein
MFIPEALAAIQHCALARTITKSNHLVIAGLQIVHIFGFLLLLGSLMLISLRRLGWVLTQWNVSKVTREPLRLFLAGQVLAVLSGTLMFLTGPTHYFYNAAFDVKMLLLVLALGTQVVILRDDGPEHWHTTLALLLWFSIAVAGRAIGFV